jgi:hypothetical protein
MTSVGIGFATASQHATLVRALGMTSVGTSFLTHADLFHSQFNIFSHVASSLTGPHGPANRHLNGLVKPGMPSGSTKQHALPTSGLIASQSDRSPPPFGLLRGKHTFAPTFASPAPGGGHIIIWLATSGSTRNKHSCIFFTLLCCKFYRIVKV